MSKSKGTAVVTGASGFLGGRLREALLEDGVDVVALVRAGSPPAKRGRSAEVDYGDQASLERVLADVKPDAIYHVAGATKGVSYQDFERGNLTPTENLMRAAERVHPNLDRFIHVSSLTSYGPSTRDEPRQEQHERLPIEFYGRSKLAAEQAVEAFGDRLRWSIVRPPSIYGPGDGDNFELFKLASRRLNVFYGNRHRLFSVVFVDDLVRAIRDCAASDATLSKGYFVCDGNVLSWEDFQGIIKDAYGKGAVTLNLPEFLVSVAAVFGEMATRIDGKPRLFNRQKAIMGAQEAWTCQSGRAAQDFGYAPRVSVREGVERTLQWYQQEGWL